MKRTIEPYEIELLTNEWWWGIGSSIVLIVFIILFFKNKKKQIQISFMKVMSVILIISWGYALSYELYEGIWSVKHSLPLHLCRISFIIGIFNLWNPKQWMFEWCLFLSIPAGFQAILTPEVPLGEGNWLLFDYYFSHASIIFVPLYLSIVMKMNPRKNAWIKMFLYLQVVALICFPLNYIFDSNYLLLRSPPSIDNPFLFIDKWPWYIFVLELAFLLHILILKFIFPSKRRVC